MKQVFYSLFFIFTFQIVGFGQDAPAALPEFGWKRVGGVGFDLSGLGIVNPRVGAGVNRFGIGGLGSFAADRKAEHWFWDNSLSLQLGVVKVGEDPFTKSIDVLRGTSKYGYSITKNKKWYAAGLVIGTTSLLKTYANNRLNDDNGNLDLFSKFLAPAQLQFHPGIEWKPDEHFSILFSPIGLNLIYVGDDALALKNIHGNEVGKNNRTQLVPAINATYKNKFLKDRVTYTSNLNLTTDWLEQPFTITALNFWQNNISIAIFKGLSLDLYGEANYDHYKLVQKDENSDGRYTLGNPKKDGDGKEIIVNGIPSYDGPDRLGRGTQWLGSFMLKYNKVF